MDFKNLRKWDTEIFNFKHLSYPKPENITHRLLTNLTYYYSNYILIFLSVFACVSLTSFKQIMFVVISVLVWRYIQSKSLDRDNSYLKYFVMLNLALILIFDFTTFLTAIGLSTIFVALHAFLVAEKGTEYEAAKEDDEDTEELSGNEGELKIQDIQSSEKVVKKEGAALLGTNATVPSYGSIVDEDDENEDGVI